MAAAVREGSSPTTTTSTTITTTTPPVIAKAGRYTVFLTPKPSADTQINTTPPKSSSVRPLSSKPSPTTPSPPPPPPLVEVPPPQFEGDLEEKSSGAFGFFWNAVAKVQRAHWSLDEFLADWIGLDQSKYQWALNDYYESHGMDTEGGKQEEAASKLQNV